MARKIKVTTSATISFLICAGRIIQDGMTKKYSYIDLFDQIIIPTGNDSFYQTFFVGGKLSVYKNSRYLVEVKIEGPNKKVIGKVSFPEADLVTGDVPLSAFFALVKFTDAGRHYIRVSVNNEDLKDGNKFYFDVVKLGGKNGE